MGFDFPHTHVTHEEVLNFILANTCPDNTDEFQNQAHDAGIDTPAVPKGWRKFTLETHCSEFIIEAILRKDANGKITYEILSLKRNDI